MTGAQETQALLDSYPCVFFFFFSLPLSILQFAPQCLLLLLPQGTLLNMKVSREIRGLETSGSLETAGLARHLPYFSVFFPLQCVGRSEEGTLERVQLGHG